MSGSDPHSPPASGPVDDTRLVPVAAAVWLTLLVATAGLAWTGVFAAAAGSMGVLVMVAHRLHRAVLVACALGILAGVSVAGVRTYALHSSAVFDAAERGAVGHAQLVITGDARLVGRQGPAWARSVQVPAEARVISTDASWSVRVPVEVVASGEQGQVWLQRPAGSRLAATVRFAPAQAGSGQAAVVRIRGPSTIVAPPSAAWRATNRVRDGLRSAVAGRRPDQRALVPALVVGDISGIPPELDTAFRRTALTHLSAVSGANLALMLAFVLTAARAVGVRGWWLRLLGLAGVVAFVGICRSEPSVLRAAAMGLVALAGLGADGTATGGGRLRRGFRTLSVATIGLLLVDPWLCRSAGFALSVLATAGIVRWGRPWAAALGRWLPGWIAEAVAVPLAAQIATQPVITAISGQVSLVGLVANALAGPFVGPATVLGFAAAGASVVSLPLAAVIGFGAGWAAQPIIWIARLGGALPGAVVALPSTTPVVIALLAAGCAVLAVLVPAALRHPVLVVAAAVVLIIALVRVPPQPGWPPRGWFLVACDVGQGDGLVLRAAPGSAVVVDTGPDPDAMNTCLDRLGVRSVPLLVLSHFHADHVGGLPGLLQGRRVGLVLTSALASPPAEATRTQALLAAAQATAVRQAQVGETLTVGDLTWQTLGPVAAPRPDAEAGEAQSSIENDSSIVGLVTVDLGGCRARVLLPGDAEPPEQRDLLGAGVDLHADILKVAHHGSSRQDEDFLAATGARMAIASAGQHNVYGHPAPSTLRRLQALGMTVLHTDTEGGVAVWCRSGHLGAVTQTQR